MSSSIKNIYKSVWFWVAVTTAIVVIVLSIQCVSRLRGGEEMGDYARPAALNDSEGNLIDLAAVIGKETLVLVFYHASW